MEVVFILIPVSLFLVIFGLWAFVWSVRNDQFEDLESEAWRVVFDDDDEVVPVKKPDLEDP